MIPAQMRYWSWAQRLLLAEISKESGAADLIGAEIGDCPSCWRTVAGHLARLAANGWYHAGDNGAVLELLLNGIAYSLDRLGQEGEDTP